MDTFSIKDLTFSKKSVNKNLMAKPLTNDELNKKYQSQLWIFHLPLQTPLSLSCSTLAPNEDSICLQEHILPCVDVKMPCNKNIKICESSWKCIKSKCTLLHFWSLNRRLAIQEIQKDLEYYQTFNREYKLKFILLHHCEKIIEIPSTLVDLISSYCLSLNLSEPSNTYKKQQYLNKMDYFYNDKRMLNGIMHGYCFYCRFSLPLQELSTYTSEKINIRYCSKESCINFC